MIASLVLASAMTGGLLLGRMALLLVVTAIGIAAGGELFRVARARGARPMAALGLVGIAGLFVVAHVRGDGAPTVLPAAVSAVLAASFLLMMFRRDRRDATKALVYTVFVVIVVGLPGSYVLALRASADGFRLVLGLVAMAVAADVVPVVLRAARGRGRHSAVHDPVWQRLVGALMGTISVAAVAAIAMAPPFTSARALVLAFLVAATATVAGPVFDMIETDLAPENGRGAIRLLPRIDAVLVSAPMFFYAFRVMAR
ncbi:MAG: phosphatidate cytidylyltransferase [Actinomycetota bacterium]